MPKPSQREVITKHNCHLVDVCSLISLLRDVSADLWHDCKVSSQAPPADDGVAVLEGLLAGPHLVAAGRHHGLAAPAGGAQRFLGGRWHVDGRGVVSPVLDQVTYKRVCEITG